MIKKGKKLCLRLILFYGRTYDSKWGLEKYFFLKNKPKHG